jgi:hypothetical protein
MCGWSGIFSYDDKNYKVSDWSTFENKIRTLHKLININNIQIIKIIDYSLNNRIFITYEDKNIDIIYHYPNGNGLYIGEINKLSELKFITEIHNGLLTIKNVNINNYWKLTETSIRFPSIKDIFGIDSYLEYYVEHNSEALVEYINYNMQNNGYIYLQLLELTHNEPSYQEILIDLGFQYVSKFKDNCMHFGSTTTCNVLINFVDMAIANYGKLSESQKMTIFDVSLHVDSLRSRDDGRCH